MTARGRGNIAMGSDWDPMRSDYETNDDEGSSSSQLDHCRLYITNIPRGLNEDGVRALFSKYGPLIEVHLSGDPNKRYALVKYETPGEAKFAMMKLNQTEPLNMNINIAHKQRHNNQQGNNRRQNQVNRNPQRQPLRQQETSRDADFFNDNVSSTSSRQLARLDMSIGDDEDYLLEADGPDQFDPDLGLEMERLRLQAERLRWTQRIRHVKEAESRTMSTSVGSRCVMTDGKIVVRTGAVNDDRDNERETAGAGDSCLTPPALQHTALRACVRCGARADAFCARCGVTPYCGPACQRRDWARRHSAVCHNLASDIPPAAPLRRPRSPVDAARRNGRDAPAGPSHNQSDKRPQQTAQGEQKTYNNKNIKRSNSTNNNNNANNNSNPRSNYTNNNNANNARNQPGRRPALRHETAPDQEEIWPAPATEPKPKPQPAAVTSPRPPPAKAAYPKPSPPAAQSNAAANASPPTANVEKPVQVEPKKTAAVETPLVPAKCVVELMDVGQTLLLEVQAPAADCACDVTGFVCVALPEDDPESYMSLCEDYVTACEADPQEFRPSPGETFSIQDPADGSWYRARQLSPDQAALLDAARLMDTKGARFKRLQQKYAALPEFCCVLSGAEVKVGDIVKCTVEARGTLGRYAVARVDAASGARRGTGHLARWTPRVANAAGPSPLPIGQFLKWKRRADPPSEPVYKEVGLPPTEAENATINRSADEDAPTVAAPAAPAPAAPAPAAPAPAAPAPDAPAAGAPAKPIPEVPRPPLQHKTEVLLVDVTPERCVLRAADNTAARLADMLEQDVAMYGLTAEPLAEPPTAGETVIAKFTDGIHYRALCRRTNVRADKYLLEYIEYGNSEVSCLEKLYPCPESLGLRARPALTSAAILPELAKAPPPQATEYLETLTGQTAILTLSSGEASAPSGSEVILTLTKNHENVNRKLQKLCTPDWKKVQDSGSDVISTDVLMLSEMEYLPVPESGCQFQLTDSSMLGGGTVAGYPAGNQDLAVNVFGPLCERMAEYCESDLGKEPYLPRVEELCIAKFPRDGRWCRAAVCEYPDGAGSPEILVTYLDYGNLFTIPVSHIRKMQREFITGIPALAASLEIRGFPNQPSKEALNAARRYLKIESEGVSGVLHAAKCETTPSGFYTVDAPELLAAMAGL